MKYAGKKFEGRSTEVVVIPRQGFSVIFKAQAVLNYDNFEKLCPLPNPPKVMKPGGVTVSNVEDPKYLEAIGKWSGYKTTWMILESLKATPELEWETIDPLKPETWSNWEDELTDGGFSQAEITAIIGIVIDACGLNQTKIDKATKDFLAGQEAELKGLSSLRTGKASTVSGEHANDLG